MIIFYKKSTGEIVGTIEGRIHGVEHKNMWIGKKSETSRIIYNWKKNEDGVYEPDVKSKKEMEIIKDLDKNKNLVYDFVIDPTTKKLAKKEKND